MLTIHKQLLKIEDVQTIEVPARAKFLSVQLQNGLITVWYACDTENPKEWRSIAMAGTGHDISHCVDKKFLGTVQLSNGALVFHIFTEE